MSILSHVSPDEEFVNSPRPPHVIDGAGASSLSSVSSPGPMHVPGLKLQEQENSHWSDSSLDSPGPWFNSIPDPSRSTTTSHFLVSPHARREADPTALKDDPTHNFDEVSVESVKPRTSEEIDPVTRHLEKMAGRISQFQGWISPQDVPQEFGEEEDDDPFDIEHMREPVSPLPFDDCVPAPTDDDFADDNLDPDLRGDFDGFQSHFNTHNFGARFTDAFDDGSLGELSMEMTQVSLDSINSEDGTDVFTGPSTSSTARSPKYVLRSRIINANSPITPTVIGKSGKMLAPVCPLPLRSALAGMNENKASR